MPGVFGMIRLDSQASGPICNESLVRFDSTVKPALRLCVRINHQSLRTFQLLKVIKSVVNSYRFFRMLDYCKSKYPLKGGPAVTADATSMDTSMNDDRTML